MKIKEKNRLINHIDKMIDIDAKKTEGSMPINVEYHKGRINAMADILWGINFNTWPKDKEENQ